MATLKVAAILPDGASGLIDFKSDSITPGREAMRLESELFRPSFSSSSGGSCSWISGSIGVGSICGSTCGSISSVELRSIFLKINKYNISINLVPKILNLEMSQ